MQLYPPKYNNLSSLLTYGIHIKLIYINIRYYRIWLGYAAESMLFCIQNISVYNIADTDSYYVNLSRLHTKHIYTYTYSIILYYIYIF